MCGVGGRALGWLPGSKERGMVGTPDLALDLDFAPLVPERWRDFERLFGEHGAVGGCWCMWWRVKRVEFEERKGEGNRLAMKAIVDAGEVPGILAYAGGEPVGWCSVAPREQYPVLQRSWVLKPVDDQPVWSVVCFFIARGYRGAGLSEALLHAAMEYARGNGASILEGYPVEPRKDRMPTVFAYTGFAHVFQRAGFEECLRRSETRPIMRCHLDRGG
jgi:GNAT superfamily N-acetyltransferase